MFLSQIRLASYLSLCFIASLYNVYAAEDSSFALLSLPMPWPQALQVEGFSESSSAEQASSGAELSSQRYSLNSTTRLFSSAQDTVLLDMHADHTAIDTTSPITFHKTGTVIPQQIDGLGFNLSYRHIDQAKRRWVTSLGLNSRSDKIGSSGSYNANALAAVHFNSSGNNGWTLGLAYTSNLAYPLPMITYTWVPNENFLLMIGIPVISLRWKITPQWTCSLVSFGLNPRLKISYTCNPQLTLYSSFGSSTTWSGYVSQRSDDDLELRHKSTRLALGADYAFTKKFKLSLEAGINTKNTLIETTGFDPFSRNQDEEIALDDSRYARLNVAWSF